MHLFFINVFDRNHLRVIGTRLVTKGILVDEVGAIVDHSGPGEFHRVAGEISEWLLK